MVLAQAICLAHEYLPRQKNLSDKVFPEYSSILILRFQFCGNKSQRPLIV